MELEQRIVIPFLDRGHGEPWDGHARLSTQFGNTASSLRSVQRWCQHIRQGRKLPDDGPRSGRLPIDFLDSNSIIPRKQPFHSAYSLAEILDVSHTTMLSHLHDSLGMKLFHLRWIPNQLMEQLRASSNQKCQEL
jgi:hypothetical protein